MHTASITGRSGTLKVTDESASSASAGRDKPLLKSSQDCLLRTNRTASA